MQLNPQSQTGPSIPDNGHLADANVEPTVTLDDILASLNPQTRKYFQEWQQSVAVGIARPRGTDQRRLRLAGTVRRTHQPAAEILAPQEGALREVIHNTGVVFNALAGRDHQLEQLIVNSEHTFHAASAASDAFAQAFRELPPFEHNSKVALEATDKFADVANPYFEEFTSHREAAVENCWRRPNRSRPSSTPS